MRLLMNLAFPHLMRRGVARPLARSTFARFASSNSEEGTNTEAEDEGDNAPSSNILREDQLYPWQRDIFEMVTQYSPHERLIHWYHDDGNSGKSALAKMLVANHGAMMMDGRSVDIKHSIHNFHEEHASYPKIIIFNLPRSAGNSLDFVGLEHVKDGNFSSTKYGGGQHTFPSPHTIVFANQAPDTRKLTLDRWRIVNLDVEKYVDTELLQELKAKRQRVALMKEEKMLMQRKALAKQRVEDELKELDEWLEGDGEE